MEERMTKLTALQHAVVAKAAARADGAAIFPTSLNKPRVTKVGSVLVARKPLREVRSKAGMPIWREDAAGKSISLVLTRAGRAVIDGGEVAVTWAKSKSKAKAGNTANVAGAAGKLPRAGTKQALVVDMLSNEQGATLDALIKARAGPVVWTAPRGF
jgi:hypothetical protein